MSRVSTAIRSLSPLLAAVLLTAADPDRGLSAADPIAYVVPAGTGGNQDFGGSLGMDFDVELDILVTRFGVFDSLSNGLARPIVAVLYDRDSLVEMARLDFTVEDPGELIGGSRFKDLDTPIDLPAGFHGTMVAAGYGAGELNGNQGVGPLVLTTDNGNCSINFVGTGRFGPAANPGDFPGTPDGGPVNRYAAGTFVFQPQEQPQPRMGIAYVVPAFSFGTDPADPAIPAPASVGLDFDVKSNIEITQLGVFDDASDGLFETLTARLYNRDSLIELATLEFTSAEPGDLVEGSRFKPLAPTVRLPAGFRGTIAVEGFNITDKFGVSPNGLASTTDHGGCQLAFVGSGRTGENAGEYPATVTVGAPNRFVAGTFEFEPTGAIELAQPPSAVQAVAGNLQIDLTWTPPAAGPAVQGYNVYQTKPGAFRKVNPAMLNGTSFSVTAGLLNGIEACFIVRSVALGLESPDSQVACAIPKTNQTAAATFIAYEAPSGTAGNNTIEGSFGLDFKANRDILISRLGVFDDGSDGIIGKVTARLFETPTGGELAAIEFTPESPGDLVGGYRFKDLPALIALPTGFRGTISADGFNATDRSLNQGNGPAPLTSDSGLCSISFGGERTGGPGAFPGSFINAPFALPIAAASFAFGPVTLPAGDPPGGIAYVVPEGTPGNQNAGVSLGMDFDVEGSIEIRRLGVFDDKSDGLFLPIKAQVFDRTNGTELAFLDFTPEDPGELVGGSRFKDLDPPLGLPKGFRGTMSASGYGNAELNGNTHGGLNPVWSTDDGGCLISFVGGSRFGGGPNVFPGTVDGGPVNRYAAGTFQFVKALIAPILPPSNLVLVPGAGKVDLSWQEPVGPPVAASYRLFRAIRPADFVEIAQPTSPSYSDTGLTDGVEVCYKLKAIGPDGQESPETKPICAVPGSSTGGGIISYVVRQGTPGVQAFAGPLGMDFDARVPVQITHLGVFDDGSDGLNLPITARLHDRTTTDVLATLDFTPEDSGVIIGGSRFKPLETPIDLPEAFQGTIAAEGYGPGEQNGNGANLGWSLDDAGCALTFVGTGRFGNPGTGFPANVDGGDRDHYAAGTFIYVPKGTVDPVNTATIAYVIPEFTVGNQEHGGALGMDFDVRADIVVTRLGVFDDLGDGLFRSITARLFDRTTQTELTMLEFTPEDPGDLEGGSRYKELAEPIELAAGFKGTMSADGYGLGEKNGNLGVAGAGTWSTDDAGCAVTFVGSGRFGDPGTPAVFPPNLDGGPVNRYASGTFEYQRKGPTGTKFRRADADSSGTVDLTDAVFVLNYLFLAGATPPCLDAADTDDTGLIDLTDGVYSLNFQFLAGPRPPDPGPDACDVDPTADPLECASGCP